MKIKMTKKRKKIVFSFFIISTTLIYGFGKNINFNFDVLLNPQDTGIHFNLINLNIIIIGFMLTLLGILVSLSGFSFVINFDKAGGMNNLYAGLISGVSCSIVSIILSFYFIFFEFNTNLIYKMVSSLELILLFLSILFLVLTLKDLNFIAQRLRKQHLLSDELIEQIKNSLNKNP
ncbi:hypothetical protein WG909_12965 [Peptostreptococcaceae bacterium AGR-M142]